MRWLRTIVIGMKVVPNSLTFDHSRLLGARPLNSPISSSGNDYYPSPKRYLYRTGAADLLRRRFPNLRPVRSPMQPVWQIPIRSLPTINTYLPRRLSLENLRCGTTLELLSAPNVALSCPLQRALEE